MSANIAEKLSVVLILSLLFLLTGIKTEANDKIWNLKQENTNTTRSITVETEEEEKVIEGEVLEVDTEEDTLLLDVYSTPHVDGGEEKFQLAIEKYDLSSGEHIVALCRGQQIVDIVIQTQEI
ncbi:MAG: hypothetical protein ACOCQC_03235 [Halanaerobiaceae bacterium]